MTNPDDVDRCAEVGIDAVGIILVKANGSPRSPDSDRRTPEEAAALVQAIGARMQSVLLIHVAEPNAIVALCQQVQPAALQIQAYVDAATLRALRNRVPGVVLYKSFKPDTADHLVAAIREYHEAGAIDAAFLDSAKGGSGEVHDWSVSARVVACLPDVRIVLAGGLNPANIGAAVRVVRPFGVDVMSGVNREGTRVAKDPDKLRAFVTAARAESQS